MTHLRITEGSEYIIHIFLQNIPYSLCFPLENVTPLRITLNGIKRKANINKKAFY